MTATSAGRAALLDQTALGQMLSAAFDTTVSPLQGPFSLQVDTLDLGLDIARPALAEGFVRIAPGAVPMDVRLRITGLLPAAPLRVDALWRGSLTARRVPQEDRVTEIGGGFAMLDLDRAILADQGALPASAPALEAARRGELLKRLRADAVQPGAITDDDVTRMIDATGAGSLGAVLEAKGAVSLGGFRLSFSAASNAAPVPVSLPVTVAVLVRDAPLRFSALLAESRSVRTALAEDPAVQPGAAALRRRTPILLLWAVPAAILDDTAWQGADRTSRRAAAAELLAAQGIALAPV